MLLITIFLFHAKVPGRVLAVPQHSPRIPTPHPGGGAAPLAPSEAFAHAPFDPSSLQQASV